MVLVLFRIHRIPQYKTQSRVDICLYVKCYAVCKIVEDVDPMRGCFVVSKYGEIYKSHTPFCKGNQWQDLTNIQLIFIAPKRSTIPTLIEEKWISVYPNCCSCCSQQSGTATLNTTLRRIRFDYHI